MAMCVDQGGACVDQGRAAVCLCARIPCAADVGLVRHAVTAAMSYVIELHGMLVTCADGSVVCVY